MLVVVLLSGACVGSPSEPVQQDGALESVDPTLVVVTTAPSTTTTTTPPTTTTTTPPTTTTRPTDGKEHSGIVCWTAEPAPGTGQISFSDATVEMGLVEPLTGMYGHAAAWGDINEDQYLDLLVGTFADRPVDIYVHRGASGPAPDRLLSRSGDGYVLNDGFPQTYGRTSGAAFADLDSDGDLDVVLSRNVKEDQALDATAIYENVGGAYRAVESGISSSLGGRSVGVLDYDGDGLLDLFIAEDRYRGGRSRLYRNLGDLQFSDVTGLAGLPEDLAGLGVATADVDDDGDVDLFVAGDNRMFIGTGDGFEEVSTDVFRWPPVGDEDDPAGAAFGDVDRDGRPDLVIGQHFNSTVDFGVPAPVRLFLNRTMSGGGIVFEDVTTASGLLPLPTKAPHVEIVDMDNDGWPDIVTSASAGDGTRPAVFRNLGLDGGIPRFEEPAGLGDSQYWVAGPAGDVDQDGRLDLLLVEFEPSLPSLLMRNESASGNWLEVSLGVEADGIGSRVFVYEPRGSSGSEGRLLGSAGITAARGYSAGVAAIAHFGLGDVEFVDVVVQLPDGRELVEPDVPVNRHIRLPEGC